MSYIKTFACFILSVFLASCVSQSYEVQSVCEVTDLYNYVVKWEVDPFIEGKVYIYSSLDPDHFDLNAPAAIEDISRGRADLVIKGSLNRRYFLLRFNDAASSVVGVRAQKFDKVDNFRDMGGYYNEERRPLKWGKLYRSGALDSIDGTCATRVQRMNIHTLIDLRMFPGEGLAPETGIKNYYSFPVYTDLQDPLPLIRMHQFKRGDALVFMQDVNAAMLLQAKHSFREMFQVLAQPDNYPVIISCNYGTLQTSLGIALVLSALDIPEHVIFEDYMLSNRYFNVRRIAYLGAELPLEIQDAITTMLVSDERYLRAAFQEITRRYGSMDQYLLKEMGVDQEFKKKLQSILLD